MIPVAVAGRPGVGAVRPRRIPAKARHGQGAFPRCREGSFGGVRAFERRRPTLLFSERKTH